MRKLPEKTEMLDPFERYCIVSTDLDKGVTMLLPSTLLVKYQWF